MFTEKGQNHTYDFQKWTFENIFIFMRYWLSIFWTHFLKAPCMLTYYIPIQPNSQAHHNIVHSSNIKRGLGVQKQSGIPGSEFTVRCYPLHLPPKSDAVLEQAAMETYGLYRELNLGPFPPESIQGICKRPTYINLKIPLFEKGSISEDLQSILITIWYSASEVFVHLPCPSSNLVYNRPLESTLATEMCHAAAYEAAMLIWGPHIFSYTIECFSKRKLI